MPTEDSPWKPSPDPRADQEPEVPRFAWWIRALAVMHVLSQWTGPLGFVVLTSTAGLLYMMSRGFNGLIIGLGLAALACPALCAAYRSWFVQWGRKNWPDGKPS